MLEYKLIFGIAGVVVGIIGYIPYCRDLIRGTTKPHTLSWLVWALLSAVAFAAQAAAGGGAGIWTTGLMALYCLMIACVALLRGETEITAFDWACFGGALLGIAFWFFTRNPLGAVSIVTVVDLVAFIPTFRKSFLRPSEETVFEYGASAVKFIFAIIALQAYALATWLYPASLVVTNGAFAVMTLLRRRQLARQAITL
jgi:hypothetical protein